MTQQSHSWAFIIEKQKPRVIQKPVHNFSSAALFVIAKTQKQLKYSQQVNG